MDTKFYTPEEYLARVAEKMTVLRQAELQEVRSKSLVELVATLELVHERVKQAMAVLDMDCHPAEVRVRKELGRVRRVVAARIFAS